MNSDTEKNLCLGKGENNLKFRYLESNELNL